MIEENKTMRQVVDGERLSGHGRGPDGYPEIVVLDRHKGSAMCSIQGFHWATVKVTGASTKLWFEDKTCLTVSGGTVEYAGNEIIAGGG
jgi:hypothetical protein